MNIVFLLIGGNLDDREQNLKIARELIERNIGKIIKASSIYETVSWGKTEQPDFLNQVLIVSTTSSAEEVMQKILFIEEQMGRIRTEKNASRIIDIDILFFNDEIIDQPSLIIPHPQIQNRRFTLIPLAEIAPNYIHPSLKKSITTLLNETKDDLEVRKFSY